MTFYRFLGQKNIFVGSSRAERPSASLLRPKDLQQGLNGLKTFLSVKKTFSESSTDRTSSFDLLGLEEIFNQDKTTFSSLLRHEDFLQVFQTSSRARRPSMCVLGKDDIHRSSMARTHIKGPLGLGDLPQVFQGKKSFIAVLWGKKTF